MRRIGFGLGLAALLLLPAFADQVFPKPDWKDLADPLASTQATAGGEISMYLGPEPDSANYYVGNMSSAAQMTGLMYESLIGGDPVTLENTPGLANKWSISDDKLTFTFWLDPAAKWSDGKPVVAADVKATYDAIMGCDKAGAIKVSLERFSSPVVVDERTVKFTAKEVHWNNLDAIGGIWILPKHLLDKTKLDDLNWEFPIVSGPYQLTSRVIGQNVVLTKRGNWWAKTQVSSQHKFNFERIKFRFFSEDNNAMEAFKKGELDIYAVYTSRIWVEETKGEKFEKNWIVKQRVFNYDPIGFQGWAMNARRELFKDIRVREALAHLVNRAKMNETLMFNVYHLHRSYYEDLYDAAHPNQNPEVDYNVEKARELLKAAGWLVNPATGKLEKDGKQFTFQWLDRSASTDKFLALYREDLAKVGITLTPVIKDLAAWQKDMDDFNFDMTWAAWGGGGPKKDPEEMWSSKEADRKSGNNITGFKDARVDALIEQQRGNFDTNERHTMVREIDGIICRQFPYILLWYKDNTRLLYWNKFGTPPQVLDKYSGESAALVYWWLDEDQESSLKDAQANGKSLRPRPADVRFDAAYKPAKPATPAPAK